MKIKVMYWEPNGQARDTKIISLEIQGDKLTSFKIIKEDRSGEQVKMAPIAVEAIQSSIYD
ncbi:hypothetical protein [Pectinatus frisingensis]|uniref:hypothetical protein n=1 Tax=Pectinatus frisingensis TaxID=865 RepID=UPI0018C5CCED|nr:hypothetical protein [Pectinatus frisingensis]